MGQTAFQFRSRSRVWTLLCGIIAGVCFVPAGPRAAAQISCPLSVPSSNNPRHNGAPFERLRAVQGPTLTGNDENQPSRKTFVDMTPAELSQAVPETKHLKPADNQDLLSQILQRVGANVAAFFDDFSNTACTEHVTSMVNPEGHTNTLDYDNKYNYVAVADAGGSKWNLHEYRTDTKGQLVKSDTEGGVVTFGFVALPVHFHPDYQADSRFRYLGRQEFEKRDTYVVAFAQKPNVARLPASVRFLSRTGVVFLQGVAWIDPESFKILRLRTDIQKPNSREGLQRETTEVTYSQVAFPKSNKSLWLPREVTVVGQIQQYVFHNEHHYSDYRLFSVQVEQKVAKP